MEVVLLGIVGLVLALLVTVISLLWYTGLFANVEIETGKPSFQTLQIAYKYATGPYKDCGPLFTELYNLAPKLQCCGVYYDDPNAVEPSKLRYIVAAILAEGDGEIDKDIETKLLENGYKPFELPAIDYAVKTTFPYVWDLSIYIAVMKVYPKLAQYTKERQLSAHPAMEIYRSNTIEFYMPLSKQEAFYVEEASAADSSEDEPATTGIEEEEEKSGTEPQEKAGTGETTQEENKKDDSGDDSGSSFEKVDVPN